MNKHFYWLLLIIVLSFWSFRPLARSGLFPIHDDTQTARVIQMFQALRSFTFPVRWTADLGYGNGYPLFNYYAPLPYYFGAFMLFITNNPQLATKLMYFVAISGAGVSMYLLASSLTGTWGGLLAGILYLYAPYHAVQIYVRGSVGEYWAYALLPLLVWSIYKALDAKNNTWITGSVILAALILSHNIISIISLFYFIIIFPPVIIMYFKKRSDPSYLVIFLRLLKILLFGLALSAFFWAPALLESKFTNVETLTQTGSKYSEHFVYLDQLWDSPWGYAGSGPQKADGLSFKIGKINIISALIGLIIIIRLYKSFTPRKKTLLVSLFTLLLVSVFMMTWASLPLWQFLEPLFKYIQFPWRLLVFVLLPLALIAAFIAKGVTDKPSQAVICLFLAILIITIHSKYFVPKEYSNHSTDYYYSDNYLKWQVSKISDEYLPSDFTKPQSIEEISTSLLSQDSKLNYQVHEDNFAHTKFTLNIEEKNEIVLNRTFSSAWKLFSENGNKPVPIYAKNGKIAFMPKSLGSLALTLKLTSTPTQAFANLISALAVLIVVYKYWQKIKKHV